MLADNNSTYLLVPHIDAGSTLLEGQVLRGGHELGRDVGEHGGGGGGGEGGERRRHGGGGEEALGTALEQRAEGEICTQTAKSSMTRGRVSFQSVQHCGGGVQAAISNGDSGTPQARIRQVVSPEKLCQARAAPCLGLELAVRRFPAFAWPCRQSACAAGSALFRLLFPWHAAGCVPDATDLPGADLRHAVDPSPAASGIPDANSRNGLCILTSPVARKYRVHRQTSQHSPEYTYAGCRRNPDMNWKAQLDATTAPVTVPPGGTS